MRYEDRLWFTDVSLSQPEMLHRLRLAAGLAPAELGAMLGIDEGLVLNAEVGNAELTTAQLLGWCVNTGGQPSVVMGHEHARLDGHALEKIIEVRKRLEAEGGDLGLA